MISTASQPEPVAVDTDAYAVAAGGDRFAWVRDEGAGAAQDPRPVTPVVMTATFINPTPMKASVLTQGPPPPQGTGRPILGAQYPSASTDIVAWQDIQTDGTWAGETDRVAVWDSQTGVASQIEPSPDPLFVGVQGGWLVWNADPLRPTAASRTCSSGCHSAASRAERPVAQVTAPYGNSRPSG